MIDQSPDADPNSERVKGVGRAESVASQTCGSQILSILQAYGVRRIFSSPGSEWPPLWDAIAERIEAGAEPVFYNIRHEELAASMAAGYNRKSDELTALVLHTTVGMLKASMALRYALHSRIPMVVLAGESSAFDEDPAYPTGIFWQHLLADVRGPAGISTSFLKWSQQITAPELLPGMLRDACRIALSPPQGPVLLSIPMEFMLQAVTPLQGPTASVAWTAHPDISAVNGIAESLLAAQRPVILTETAGQQPENVTGLADLASILGIPVLEAPFPSYVNLPDDHSLHLGFKAEPFVNKADVVLLIGCAVPWHPASRRPPGVQQVILLDDYPTYDLLPYWGVGVDQCVGGSLKQSLIQLCSRLHAELPFRPEVAERAARRHAECARLHGEQRQSWQAEVAEVRGKWPIDSRWLTVELASLLPEDAIFTYELITDKSSVHRFIPRKRGGTLIGHTSGGLGVGMGIALGVKVAAPDQVVVLLIGDGSFHYNPVVSAFGFSQQYGMPLLTIVANNGQYASMRNAHAHYCPDGWGVRFNRFPGAVIEPPPNYADVCRAYGGWGRRVESPEELRPTLAEAVERVRAGQQALVDVPTRSGRP